MWWPFGESSTDKKNAALRMMSAHIKECHKAMNDAALYLENPFVGRNPNAIANDLRKLMHGYGK